jgi:PIN domain nuclease of toxin-antitoxin system
VSLLLDTHVVLWGLAAAPELDTEFLDRLRHDPDIHLSPVSLWEVTIKQAGGKLGGPPDLAERMVELGFRDLPVTHAHAVAAGRLPLLQRDPFDRMLVAQAAVAGLTLVTRDRDIRRYDVDLLVV